MEDESSLQKKVDLSTRFPLLLLIILGIIVICGAFGIFILASTPMKNYLPGYLKESERTATEEQHLRLDSLVHVYEINEAYISGILSALNPMEVNPERNRQSDTPAQLSSDSLMGPSEVEAEFMQRIQERDKYNISYISPLAAQSLMFENVNNSAIITQETKNNFKAGLILPRDASVAAVADGKVISVAASPNASGAFEVIIQHPKGFLSKSSRLANVMVTPGDKVSSGQIIADASFNPGMKANFITFELWHDGDPLLPSEYLKNKD